MKCHISLYFLFCIDIVTVYTWSVAQDSSVTQNSVDVDAQTALDKYSKFSTAGLSAEERITQYQEWRRTFTSLIEKNPSDAIRTKLLRQTLYICNALGDTNQSFEMIDELLKQKEITIQEQFEWYTEYGEVAHSGFIRSLHQDKELAFKAVDAFEKANKLLEQLETNQRFLEQKILNLAWTGSILRTFKDSKEYLLKARECYQQARMLRQTFGEPSARLKLTNYDEENFLFNDARISAYLDDINGMEKALKLLDKLPNKNNYGGLTSSYIADIMMSAFIERGKDPRDFLIRWISENPDDARTWNLVVYITESYMKNKPDNYLDDVLPYLISLVDGKYADSLKALESKRIEQKVGGGLYAAALLDIIQVYKAKEDFETANKYNDRYITMFSNDKINTPLAARDKLDMESKIAIQNIERKKISGSVFEISLRIVLIVAGIILCLLALYLKFRRRV
jgi:tetratricopeptide (TPR) repeat protein